MASIFRGFSFPFRKAGSVFPAQATDAELIRESLFQIILTSRGERLMRPSYGTNAQAYVFDNNDLILQENLRTDTQNAITRYEPRVILLTIDMIRDVDKGKITLDIVYVIRQTRQTQRLQVTVGTV